MKEFNLEEFKKNPSQKVVLRSDSDVRIICTDKKGEFPIVALVEDDNEGEFTICYRKTGRFLIERESPNDLFFAPEKKEYFDSKTLQPFDRVLVRNFKACKLKCEHFSYFNENDDYLCMCFSNSYAFCIPYNDETKHLVGTTDEAPEYYRYWEE